MKKAIEKQIEKQLARVGADSSTVGPYASIEVEDLPKGMIRLWDQWEEITLSASKVKEILSSLPDGAGWEETWMALAWSEE